MYYAISFMMIGNFILSSKPVLLADPKISAQIGGIALALAIAGSVFVNSAQNALVTILPDYPLSELQQAISGTSSAFFNGLPDDTRTMALDALIKALQKVYVRPYFGTTQSLTCTLLLVVLSVPTQPQP